MENLELANMHLVTDKMDIHPASCADAGQWTHYSGTQHSRPVVNDATPAKEFSPAALGYRMSENTQYLACGVDLAMVSQRLDDHEMRLSPRNTWKPKVERRVSGYPVQSGSEYATSQRGGEGVI